MIPSPRTCYIATYTFTLDGDFMYGFTHIYAYSMEQAIEQARHDISIIYLQDFKLKSVETATGSFHSVTFNRTV